MRDLLTEVYRGAITGAAAGPATARALGKLAIPRERRVWVFAIGKAAHAMAGAATAALQRTLHQVVGGIIVAPETGPTPYGTITAMIGDHPLPGRNSFTAAARLGEVAAGRRSGDVALVLLSGGASSLIGAPLRGLGEAEFTQLCQLLLESGLDIASMNVVRKRFSRWGGGRLALALAPAATHCLVVSDVVGDDLAAIGSGPCAPDPNTVHEVTAILQRANLLTRIPPSYRDMLGSVARGMTPETPKRTHPAFAHVTARVIANNRLALDGAAAAAREYGVESVQVVDAPLVGEASARGAEVARTLVDLAARPQDTPRLMIWGGETTVTVQPPPAAPARGTAQAMPARPTPPGGRCQELALAAARVLAEASERATSVTILAAGTDGRDGTTDAAGAVVDARTWGEIAAAGRDPAATLAAHEAHAALDAAGALFRTGPTGTNVSDVVIGLVD